MTIGKHILSYVRQFSLSCPVSHECQMFLRNLKLPFKVISLVLILRSDASSESQGKPDDIQALDKKLRSLFMDLGGGVASAQGDILAVDMASGASVAGTSSPVGPSSTSTTAITAQSANPPQPPSSLALGSLGSSAPVQGPGTPVSTPAQTGRCMNGFLRVCYN